MICLHYSQSIFFTLRTSGINSAWKFRILRTKLHSASHRPIRCSNLVPRTCVLSVSGYRTPNALRQHYKLEPQNPFSSSEPRSFWPAAGIESSGRTRFSEHVQSIRFKFSANQICQIWREVRESRTSGVGQNQSFRSLAQVRRIVALGTRMHKTLVPIDCARSFKFNKAFWTCLERVTPVSNVGSPSDFSQVSNSWCALWVRDSRCGI